MIYYWIPFLISVFNCILKANRINKILCKLIILLMITLTALRHESVGTDSIKYASGATGGFFTSHPTELVSIFLMQLNANLGLSYTSYFTFFALITYIPTFFVLNRVLKCKLKYGILLFIIGNNIYFLDSLNAIRQLAASSLFFFAYYILQEYRSSMKKLLSVVVFIFAFGIHNSVGLVVPFVFLTYISLKPRTASRILLVCLIYSFVFSSFLDKSVVVAALKFVELNFGIHDYSWYFQNDKYDSGYNLIGLIPLLFLPSIVCSLVLKVTYKTKYYKYSLMYFWGLVLLAIISPLLAISVRATQGLTFFELLVIPIAISKMYPKIKAMIFSYFIVYSIYFGYFLLTLYSDPMQLGPYKFFFN